MWLKSSTNRAKKTQLSTENNIDKAKTTGKHA